MVRNILFVFAAGAMGAACGGHKSDTLFLDYAIEGSAGASPGRSPERATGIMTGPVMSETGIPETAATEARRAGQSSSGGAKAVAPDDCRDWRFDGAPCAMTIEDDDLLDPMEEGFADRDELDDDIADDILDDLDPDIDDELNDD